MTLFSQIEHKSIHMVPGEKIIPAKAFATLKEAHEILSEARQEAEALIQKTQQECIETKAAAHEAGFQEGLAQLNHAILQLNHSIHQLSDEMQKQIFPIAIKAAKKILGEELELHPDRIVSIILQALKPVVQHHRVTIYVNKDELRIVEKEKPKIKKILKQGELSIQERPDIEKGGCIIETEAGIINAQLENQWLALETAFKKFSKK